jgi:hypothetical protein
MAKLGFTIAIVVIITGALWIEQGHRLVVEPLAAEMIAAQACPGTDAVPYSGRCLEFIQTTGDATRVR